MIDLIGRAAARLDLNAPEGKPQDKPRAEPWLDRDARNDAADDAANDTGADTLASRLEPTILASLATESMTDSASARFDVPPGGPAESFAAAAMIEAAAEAQHREAAEAQAHTARVAAANTITLDWANLGLNGYLTPHTQSSLKAEEFRIIKRPLLRAAFSPEKHRSSIAHMVMVTSPAPGDGKTFNAINLAVSIASERDLQVLLIDADPRNRGLSKTLGLADRSGLTELLTNPELSIADVSLRTDIPNLAIIPAGQPITGSTEMMASQSMARLVRDISSRYKNRFVIFDAPPVLASGEPGVLAAHVGQIVMVVRAFETGKRAIARSLAQVSECRIVNFIVNQIPLSAAPDRYEYYGQESAQSLPATGVPAAALRASGNQASGSHV